MAEEVEREEGLPREPGACPQCGESAEWVPVDGGRFGRACRACGWAQLPESVVVRQTVDSLLHRMFPRSRLLELVDYLRMARAARREEKE